MTAIINDDDIGLIGRGFVFIILLVVKIPIYFCFLFLGASEMLMANAVSQLAARTPGKEASAMESFAAALRQVSQSLYVQMTIS